MDQVHHADKILIRLQCAQVQLLQLVVELIPHWAYADDLRQDGLLVPKRAL
jgi:hypothetical protein